jgi:dihydrodiol dehydrogenase / D-xylose 1-dehydrogenase (NADP)
MDGKVSHLLIGSLLSGIVSILTCSVSINGSERVSDKISWGILGTGNIAHQFATALNAMDDAVIAAVGSRTQKSADAFGNEFGVPRRHPSYQALADDPDVDLIYVATPHGLHKENTIMCLEAGKGVLCEKPFTINRGDAEEVIAVARKHQVFLMEAMWTRFIPAVQQALKWIDEGAIGDVRMVQASFGFRWDAPEGAALFDPAMGGGSLLDVGIYPITLAHLAFGDAPHRIQSIPTLGRNGIDEQAAMVLGFDGGGLAVLASAIMTDTPTDAWIMGTKGMIQLHDEFWCASKVSLKRGDADPETHEFPLMCNGYEYEAQEAQTCYRAGKLESETMSHATTLEMLDILDELRAQWGLKYPME